MIGPKIYIALLGIQCTLNTFKVRLCLMSSPHNRHSRTSGRRSSCLLRRLVVSRPLIRRNEDTGCEGAETASISKQALYSNSRVHKRHSSGFSFCLQKENEFLVLRRGSWTSPQNNAEDSPSYSES